MARSRAMPGEVSPISGPFDGVVEDLALVTNAERELAYLENGYLPDGRIRVRPPFALFPSPVAQPLDVPVQGIGHATPRAGGTVNWKVAAGALYIGVDDAPSVLVDLGAVLLSAAAERVYGVTFANYLILSDGVNRPFKVSLTDFAVSHLTNFAEPAYGPPVVYYDKIFFILDGKRTEIQWSEEGDPDIGYLGPCDAGGNFDNAWELRQTSQDALSMLVASNAALVYFRLQGIGVIHGPATDQFQAQGVHDGISRKLGTRSPGASVLLDNGALWFVDHLGRPALAEMAGGAREIVGPQVHLRGDAQAAFLDRILMQHHADLGLVLIAHPMASEWPQTVLVFADGQSTAARYNGRWLLPESAQVRAMGTWRIAGLDVPEVVVMGDQLGRVWGLREPLPAVHEDVTTEDGSEVTPFTRIARTAPMGYEPGVPKLWDMLVLQVAAPPGSAPEGSVLVSYITPKGGRIPFELAPKGSFTGDGADAPQTAYAGIMGYGNMIQVTVSSSTIGSEYDILAIGAKGTADGAEVEFA